MTKLTFTKPQQEWVDCFLDVMDDPEQYPDGQPTFEEVLARPDYTADLLYRLEIQAQDMCGDGYLESGIGALAEGRAALNAAKKIREHLNF